MGWPWQGRPTCRSLRMLLCKKSHSLGWAGDFLLSLHTTSHIWGALSGKSIIFKRRTRWSQIISRGLEQVRAPKPEPWGNSPVLHQDWGRRTWQKEPAMKNLGDTLNTMSLLPVLILQQKHFSQTSFHQILYISTRNCSNEEMTFFRWLCSRSHFSSESLSKKKNPTKKNWQRWHTHGYFHQILSLIGLPTFSLNVLCAGKAWAAHLEHFTHTAASLAWEEGTLTC